MEDVRKILNVKIESPYWDEAYEKALKEPQIPEWMTKDYIQSLHDDCGLLPQYYETVIAVAEKVSQNPSLCLLAKTLAHILATKVGYSKAFTKFELPQAPADTVDTLAYDCFAVLTIVANLKATRDELLNRGMPEEFVTLGEVECFIKQSTEKAGKPAFDIEFFEIYSIAIYVKFFVVGRLRFEIHPNSDRPAKIFKNKDGKLYVLMDNITIHKSGHILGSFGCTDEDGSFFAEITETDDAYEGYSVDEKTRLVQKVRTVLSKKEWQPVFVPGDDVIKVHIPRNGKLAKEACEKSYALAKDIFPRCFPEYNFKGFLLGCWMLSPELRDVLNADSNIIQFQSDYEVFPLKNNAADAYRYVFGISDTPADKIDYESLPDTNTLMRGIKQKGLESKYIHQFNGFIPW